DRVFRVERHEAELVQFERKSLAERQAPLDAVELAVAAAGIAAGRLEYEQRFDPRKRAGVREEERVAYGRDHAVLAEAVALEPAVILRAASTEIEPVAAALEEGAVQRLRGVHAGVVIAVAGGRHGRRADQGAGRARVGRLAARRSRRQEGARPL